ncbi:preprotein translocase subunit YajC [Geomesophilobacter sediminis]|uniref:Sec translocon accessory complex subunit YajC n=1 Tax=Geomesophilobacter sediminis TaxID=2798584 RepID=A0A8J7J9Y3_9BACT|nr:preprotein translocase subunit YajC [Geomesophilobacter sediminis]MBJ6723561.1 preprotein translocase subunit YajC [Geomesophilobacter sediminis]
MLGLAFAMASPPGGASGAASNPFAQFIPLILMFAIFYFLLIRPQQKKAKEHRSLLEGLKKGDQVVTAGGMHGKVTDINDQVVTIEVSPGVNIKFNKGFIASIVKKD